MSYHKVQALESKMNKKLEILQNLWENEMQKYQSSSSSVTKWPRSMELSSSLSSEDGETSFFGGGIGRFDYPQIQKLKLTDNQDEEEEEGEDEMTDEEIPLKEDEESTSGSRDTMSHAAIHGSKTKSKVGASLKKTVPLIPTKLGPTNRSGDVSKNTKDSLRNSHHATKESKTRTRSESQTRKSSASGNQAEHEGDGKSWV
jgi:hypothetical protein